MNYRASAWLRRSLRASGMPLSACAVAYVIATYVDADGRTRIPVTNATIGADLGGMRIRNVQKLTARLRGAGVLAVEYSGQDGSVYRIPYNRELYTPMSVRTGVPMSVRTPTHVRTDMAPIKRYVGTSAPVCDSCGERVSEPGRWRHEGCATPERTATG